MTSLSRILFLRFSISRLLRPASGGLFVGARGGRGRLISISHRQLQQGQDKNEVDKTDTVVGDSYKAQGSPAECGVDPDELEKFAQQVETLTFIDEHRQAMPPFVKGFLHGEVGASRLKK